MSSNVKRLPSPLVCRLKVAYLWKVVFQSHDRVQLVRSGRGAHKCLQLLSGRSRAQQTVMRSRINEALIKSSMFTRNTEKEKPWMLREALVLFYSPLQQSQRKKCKVWPDKGVLLPSCNWKARQGGGATSWFHLQYLQLNKHLVSSPVLHACEFQITQRLKRTLHINWLKAEHMEVSAQWFLWGGGGGFAVAAEWHWMWGLN